MKFTLDAGWTPPGGHWATAGEFFHETAEFFDPIQGAVANCYYIASLLAIAWATPFRIAHMTRATGVSQPEFNDLIHFYKPDSAGGLDKDIQVTESVPLNAWGDFIYCRLSEAGETWPAIYEKAYGKLKTGTATDMPDITQTAWGDCVWATAQLNGGSRSYYNTKDYTADQLWNLLRSNCLSYRTFNPMTAWTYSSGDAAPDHVDYSSANIVGSHCYTVLGSVRARSDFVLCWRQERPASAVRSYGLASGRVRHGYSFGDGRKIYTVVARWKGPTGANKAQATTCWSSRFNTSMLSDDELVIPDSEP